MVKEDLQQIGGNIVVSIGGNTVVSIRGNSGKTRGGNTVTTSLWLHRS